MRDLNPRPPDPKSGALPSWANPGDESYVNYASLAAAAFGTVAGAVRIELTSSVLETEVLAFERHPNINKAE